MKKKNEERVFLLSTTHGAEMSSLGAFVQTVNFLKKKDVIKKNWRYGFELINRANEIANHLNISEYFKFFGPACSPFYICKGLDHKISFEFRTLFIQEMLRNNVLMPWVSVAYRHNNKTFKHTEIALEKSLIIYRKALNNGVKNYLKGDAIKPVFRRFN